MDKKEFKKIYLNVILKILTKFQDLTRKLLIQHTEIRRVYNFTIFSLNTLKHDGFEPFIHQVGNITTERYIRSSKVPIIETKIVQPITALSLIKTLQGSFILPANNLYKINFFTTISQRKIAGIKLQIFDEKETIIRERTVKGSEIKEDGYTSFKFKPIKESKDKVFYFKLKSIGEPSASVWYENLNEAKELTLFYDNAALNGSIGFQAFSDIGIKPEYDLWMLKNNLNNLIERQYIKKEQNFSYRPKISIIMPVYNVNELWLEKAIDSVRNQIYTNWELCIADDASAKKHIKSILAKYSEMDSRIKIKYLSKNLGISGASNEALSLATGEFIGLLDNDDELSIDALYEVVKLLDEKPKTDFIYSDEDKINLEGMRWQPFFKPGWSPDILLSINYICHFTVIRKKIIEDIGRFRLGVEGSQDHDLFLRAMEKTNNVEHIPKILYHWRMTPGSTALNISAKDYAGINGVRSVQDYLKRQDIEGVVTSDDFCATYYHIRYAVKGDPLVSIIIHLNDDIQYVKKCINSIILNEGETRYEVLLLIANINEISSISILNQIKKNPNIRILTYDLSLNASAISNFAVERASGDYLLFLSSKIEITTKNWLSYLLIHAQRKEIGCVGPKILNIDGTIKNAGIVFGKNGETCNVFSGLPENYATSFGLSTWSRNYLAISGECLMINKDKFFQVGGFDELLNINLSIIDLCLKVHKKGYRNLYTAALFVYSYGICSRRDEISRNDIQEILRSYKECLENGDPFYNSNFSLEDGKCRLNLYPQTAFSLNI